MTLVDRIHAHYFADWEHPYVTYRKEVRRYVSPESVILDAGCGRTAPDLRQFIGAAKRLIGIDLVKQIPDLGVEYYERDLTETKLPSGSMDLIMSRSVVEHIEYPAATFAEMYRVLKPGGRFVFLTANFWDYASLIASVVPNRLHPWIVSKTEGREQEDTFPVMYRANTRGAIEAYAKGCNFELESFRYLGQWPDYLKFSSVLYLLGSWYERSIAAFESTQFLRGWILCTLRKPAQK